ncbi:MAG: SDR family oxidoreductase [Anaerolineaceae bacterium]|nr:SDR family oxidoreductase [Anaerolineaceae bacterium]
MRILVTGAAGFLGSHLCDKLLNGGHEVIGMDNFITGNPRNLEHLAGNSNFLFIRHDVSNFIFAPGKIDAVMHFASPASPNIKSPYGYPNLPIQTMKAGALGTHNTLGVAKLNNARFLLASTSEIYGDPKVNPQTEDYWGNVNPIGPRSMYDEAKRFAEALVMSYHRFHKIDTRIVRIFNTYGTRMRLDDGRVVPNFIQQALTKKPLTIYGDGSQTRSFCFVDDLIDGIVKLLFSEETMPVNIGNPVEISILQLAEIVNKICANPAGIVIEEHLQLGNDPKRRQPDISRAKSILGWEPLVPVEEGIERILPFFIKKLGMT